MPLLQDALCAVVPTWNEAERIGPLLGALRAEVDELVVVDGHSEDETAPRAVAGGARVVHAARGRAAQLQAGVEASRAPLLWFVHADSAVWPGSGAAIKAAAGAADWGCLQVEIDDPDPRLRFTAWWMNARARHVRSATGDMGVWARRSALASVGGWPQVALCEDLALCAALRPAFAFAALSQPIGTSARRWRGAGVQRTILTMWAVRAAWQLGAPPAALAWLYEGRRPRR
ncbi:MAG: TIGR04283 family arsenosugar biosynthesis glycosyltransferase [Deltaproteobacteria bacterium]|nr:TIGR04283 family arsenosugar biosynthesis glycosyltransferase [Deltaproteobacteria bacterium]